MKQLLALYVSLTLVAGPAIAAEMDVLEQIAVSGDDGRFDGAAFVGTAQPVAAEQPIVSAEVEDRLDRMLHRIPKIGTRSDVATDLGAAAFSVPILGLGGIMHGAKEGGAITDVAIFDQIFGLIGGAVGAVIGVIAGVVAMLAHMGAGFIDAFHGDFA